MKTADLLAELDRDRPPCAVCQKPVTSKDARLVSIPIDTGPSLDPATGIKLALLPFHSGCVKEGLERIERAKAGRSN